MTKDVQFTIGAIGALLLVGAVADFLILGTAGAGLGILMIAVGLGLGAGALRASDTRRESAGFQATQSGDRLR